MLRGRGTFSTKPDPAQGASDLCYLPTTLKEERCTSILRGAAFLWSPYSWLAVCASAFWKIC